MPLPIVAIVGRPNVGKSTLFNRLVGFKRSLVHDRPGVTRDRVYEEAELLARSVLLVDTGGFEPSPDDDLLKAMRRQTIMAIEQADVLVFVVDGQTGWTPADAEVGDLLRRTAKPVVMCVNKVDGPRHDGMVADFYAVGMTLFPMSAEHGVGMYEVCEAIEAGLPAPDEEELEPVDEDSDDDMSLDLASEEAKEDVGERPWEGPIRVAVLGRPNIGKSTLINRLLGEERHLVFDQPGTTTDPIDSPLVVNGRPYVLVDTAGVRRKARIDDAVERWVSLRSIRAIERCHVTLLMLDATEGPTDQDARLAQLVLERGRALILLVNKWDLTKENDEIDSRQFEAEVARKLTHLTFAPHLFISAKTGKGCGRILGLVEEVFGEFNRRVSTSQLNKFLEIALHAHSPPQRHHHPVRLYYMNQARVRPPTFVVFCNTPEGVAPQYKRYLASQLRESFGFLGTPLRIVLRKRRRIGEEAGS